MLAGAIYIEGALFMEWPLGYWTERHGPDNLTDALLFLPPLLSLFLGILLSGPHITDWTFVMAGTDTSIAALMLGVLVHGHLVAVFSGSILIYGFMAEVLSEHLQILWAATMVISLMHFWYDGFMGSVRKPGV